MANLEGEVSDLFIPLKYDEVRVDHEVKFFLKFKMFATLNHPPWISNHGQNSSDTDSKIS